MSEWVSESGLCRHLKGYGMEWCMYSSSRDKLEEEDPLLFLPSSFFVALQSRIQTKRKEEEGNMNKVKKIRSYPIQWTRSDVDGREL